MTFHVVVCPLGVCHWRSQPFANETVAVEELRAHLNGHSHPDLVGYAVIGYESEQYQRREGERA